MRKRGTIPLTLILFVTFLILGTIFYHYTESWEWIDSFYFSGMTITTVGYGDLVPSTTLSKIFTVLYVIAGLGIFLDLISKLFKRKIMHGNKNKIKFKK
ncbi:MAG: potassium channel family protein [Candidatus Pacearchaeota archaeon]|nr:potassium channel family protein [Candidatus Pacearchaeota archaeon]